jgi:hypothetical protein
MNCGLQISDCGLNGEETAKKRVFWALGFSIRNPQSEIRDRKAWVRGE